MAPRLTILNGPSQGISMILPTQGTIVLGRHPKCHLQFSDVRISVYHCRLFKTENAYCIEDLKSTNGTKLNQKAISGQTILNSGDEIQIGETQIRFLNEEISLGYKPPELMPTQALSLPHMSDAASLGSQAPSCNISLGYSQGSLISQQGSASQGFSNPQQASQQGLSSVGSLASQIPVSLEASNTPKYQVGEYELLKKIGDGAMGQVFKGRHIPSGKIVALKMLHSYLMDEISLKRFLQEVQICMKFDHPKIVKVFDFAMYHSRPVIVMEYIEGRTLKERIKNKGPVSLKLALHLGAQIAQGIHYAHKHGVVHRDLNPANVLVNSKCEVKIIDFGLVKIHGKNITVSNETLGTLHYIPPEQIENASSVDHRADIYALGATLYHAILGKPPFFDIQGVNALTIRITEHPAAPLSTLMQIPAAVSAIIEKAMALDQSKRFQTAQEFFKSLVLELQKLLKKK